MITKHKYLPRFYYESVFDIPYDNFFSKDKIKVLFFDLDNTLLSPQENELNLNIRKLLKRLNKRFKIVIISNASFKKVHYIAKKNNLDYIYLNIYHKKPSIWGFEKALKLFNLRSEEIMMIGDQLRTDIAGANKMNIISVLVKPLNRKYESFRTKLIRFLIEKPFIKNIKKINLQEYQKKFQNFIKS